MQSPFKKDHHSKTISTKCKVSISIFFFSIYKPNELNCFSIFLRGSILKMLNERYPEKLKQKWVDKQLDCPKQENEEDGISIMNIGGVFVVVIIGIVFAFVVLIVEFWYIKYYKKKYNIIEVAEYPREVLTSFNSMQKIMITTTIQGAKRKEIKRRPKDTQKNILA